MTLSLQSFAVFILWPPGPGCRVSVTFADVPSIVPLSPEVECSEEEDDEEDGEDYNDDDDEDDNDDTQSSPKRYI